MENRRSSSEMRQNSCFGVRESKVVLIGDASVGKTSLLNRFSTGSHSQLISPTLGAAFTTKMVEVNGESVKLQIWDTSGEEKYRSMAPLYYRSAAVAIVVYDITSESSFDNLDMWINQLKSHVLQNAMIIVVGNKVDLDDEGLRAVPEEKAARFCADKKFEFFEASAVTGLNVDKLFQTVAAFNGTTVKPNQRELVIPNADAETQEEKKCC